METIYTNYDYENYMEDAKENLKAQMEEYGEEGEPSVDEIYTEAADMCNSDWDFYYDCICNYLQSHNLIATGTVGTWLGRVEGGLVIETPQDFLSLLKDCDYIKIGMDDRQMIIKCSHHDGTNYYELREMLESDYEYYGEHMYDDRRELCEYLFNRGIKPQIKWYL